MFILKLYGGLYVMLVVYISMTRLNLPYGIMIIGIDYGKLLAPKYLGTQNIADHILSYSFSFLCILLLYFIFLIPTRLI